MVGALIRSHKQHKGIAHKVMWLFLDWRVNIVFQDSQRFVPFSRLLLVK